MQLEHCNVSLKLFSLVKEFIRESNCKTHSDISFSFTFSNDLLADVKNICWSLEVTVTSIHWGCPKTGKVHRRPQRSGKE